MAAVGGHDAAVRAAWNEYLAQTRSLGNRRYEEVEPWAWARLQVELERLCALAAIGSSG